MTGALALARPAFAASPWPDLNEQIAATNEGRSDAVVLIAIEDYAKLDDVIGARLSADVWMRWFVEGRGVSPSRVFKAYDADATDIKLRELAHAGAAAVQPGGTLWFVFIGHGAPSRDGSDGLLVGVDADRSADGIYGRSVSRTEVLGLLDSGRQAQTVALLDACFSGQTGGGQALVGGLQPIIPTALLSQVTPRARVLTAAGSGEFSGPLPGDARPAFSYLALGGLIGWADIDGDGDRDGRVSASELRAYVHGAMNLTVDGRTQTPALIGADADLSAAVSSRAPRLTQVKAALAEAAKVAQSPVGGFEALGAARWESGGVTVQTRIGPVTVSAPLRQLEGRYYDAANREIGFDQIRALAAVTPEGAAFESRYDEEKSAFYSGLMRPRAARNGLILGVGGAMLVAGSVTVGKLTSSAGVQAETIEDIRALHTANAVAWGGLIGGPTCSLAYVLTDQMTRRRRAKEYATYHADANRLLELANEQAPEPRP